MTMQTLEMAVPLFRICRGNGAAGDDRHEVLYSLAEGVLGIHGADLLERVFDGCLFLAAGAFRQPAQNALRAGRGDRRQCVDRGHPHLEIRITRQPGQALHSA